MAVTNPRLVTMAAPAPDRAASVERRCIATGVVRETSRLVRFVVGPEDRLVPDTGAELPGRGIWVGADREALAEAIRRKAFQRAARRPLVVDPDLVRTVEGLLVARALGLLGLARRAGQVVLGFEKVKRLLDQNGAEILLQASDAATGGRGKLSARAGGAVEVSNFTVAELSLALGRQNVVHAALCRGGLARRFLNETARVSGFRKLQRTKDEPNVAGEQVQ